MMGFGKVMLGVSGGVLALAIVAAQAQTAPTVPPAQAQPSAPAAAAPAAAADPAIKAKVEKTCSACHVFNQVSAQHKTAEQWGATVDQMIALGAPVTDEDYPKIVAYLAATYPAGSAPSGR